jgi:tetratricopeptide (TPR) repeat protein
MRDRLQDAEKSFRRAVVLQAKLVAESPGVPDYQQELAMSHTHLGAVLQSVGQPREAQQEYQQALAAWEKVVAASPAVSDYHNQYGSSLHNLAVLMEAQGEDAEVCRLTNLAVGAQRKALELNAKHPGYRRQLESHLIVLAKALLRLERHAEAAEAAAELVHDFPAIPDRALDASILWARCASVAREDKRLSASQRQEAAGTYADRVMNQLRALLPLGFQDAKLLREHKDFVLLRSRPDFQRLLREIEAEAAAEPK